MRSHWSRKGLDPMCLGVLIRKGQDTKADTERTPCVIGDEGSRDAAASQGCQELPATTGSWKRQGKDSA